MNIHLQSITDVIKLNNQLSEDEKNLLLKAVREVDKSITVLDFKYMRVVKEKRTTSVLLDETIDELQRKSLVAEQANFSLKKAYEDLKLTQNQLIQAEKMASLGELTAGIAHEIQNPLNFVNNFSDLSMELAVEMQQELTEGNNQDAILIAADIVQNLEKINHHGKRADAIVKAMLLHSRVNTNHKEPTNINTLADEYLWLSYHGARAKDKFFNASVLAHYEENLPLVMLVSQDMGRVLLNLFNNAFYAVKQRQEKAGAAYSPEVMVTTSVKDGRVQIAVKDNGTGIPEAVKDKVFQPFFTTKPTGEGTGLGLSLSYDIVTKVHGGSIQVNSKEGEYSEFIISLPLKA